MGVKDIDVWELPEEPDEKEKPARQPDEVQEPCGWEQAGLVRRGNYLVRASDVEREVNPLTPEGIDRIIEDSMRHKPELRRALRGMSSFSARVRNMVFR